MLPESVLEASARKGEEWDTGAVQNGADKSAVQIRASHIRRRAGEYYEIGEVAQGEKGQWNRAYRRSSTVHTMYISNQAVLKHAATHVK